MIRWEHLLGPRRSVPHQVSSVPQWPARAPPGTSEVVPHQVSNVPQWPVRAPPGTSGGCPSSSEQCTTMAGESTSWDLGGLSLIKWAMYHNGRWEHLLGPRRVVPHQVSSVPQWKAIHMLAGKVSGGSTITYCTHRDITTYEFRNQWPNGWNWLINTAHMLTIIFVSLLKLFVNKLRNSVFIRYL